MLDDAKSALLTGFVLLAHATGAELQDVRPKDYVDGLQYAIETLKGYLPNAAANANALSIVQSAAADIQGEKLRVESLAS